MGSVLGSCLGSCVASCGCAACEQVTGAVQDKRTPYLIILFLITLIAGLLRYYGDSLHLEYIVLVDACIDSARCYGIGAVYRLTFCMFLFFGFHVLASLATSCAKKRIDKGLWGLKTVFLLGLLVVSFLLPPATFEGFRWIALVGGAIFIIVQVIILIDWAYAWNEEWVERGYKRRVVACAITNYLLSLAAIIFLFIKLASGSGCGLEQSFIGITIAVTLMFSIISILEFCEHGAILPSSVCTLYCYWVLYSALSSSPDAQCNQFLQRSTPQIVLGFIIAAISVAYNSFYASANTHALMISGDKQQALLTAPVKLVGENSSVDEAPEPEDSEAASRAEHTASRHFQLIMTSGACYACMLLTDWGESTLPDQTPGFMSVWVQVVSQWLVMVLYTWSLLAPHVLTHRQF